jgi:hypothetical protein
MHQAIYFHDFPSVDSDFFLLQNLAFHFKIDLKIPGKNHWFGVKKISFKKPVRSGSTGTGEPFANSSRYVAFGLFYSTRGFNISLRLSWLLGVEKSNTRKTFDIYRATQLQQIKILKISCFPFSMSSRLNLIRLKHQK